MSPWRRLAARRRQPDADLRTCRSCSSEHVIAATWTRQDEQSWSIILRCADCDAAWEVVVSDAAARRYDRGMHAIARALDRLERDLVDADDFAR